MKYVYRCQWLFWSSWMVCYYAPSFNLMKIRGLRYKTMCAWCYATPYPHHYRFQWFYQWKENGSLCWVSERWHSGFYFVRLRRFYMLQMLNPMHANWVCWNMWYNLPTWMDKIYPDIYMNNFLTRRYIRVLLYLIHKYLSVFLLLKVYYIEHLFQHI